MSAMNIRDLNALIWSLPTSRRRGAAKSPLKSALILFDRDIGAARGPEASLQIKKSHPRKLSRGLYIASKPKFS